MTVRSIRDAKEVENNKQKGRQMNTLSFMNKHRMPMHGILHCENHINGF